MGSSPAAECRTLFLSILLAVLGYPQAEVIHTVKFKFY
jgi:hypothetical protein